MPQNGVWPGEIVACICIFSASAWPAKERVRDILFGKVQAHSLHSLGPKNFPFFLAIKHCPALCQHGQNGVGENVNHVQKGKHHWAEGRQ